MTKPKDDWYGHLETLPGVLEADLDYINRKDRSYGASWKKRGGVGAFMMMARKWDRLEVMMDAVKFDVFQAVAEQSGDGQGSDGTVIAEIRDLRRYLALVEAEMVSKGHVTSGSTTSAQDVMKRDLAQRTFKDAPGDRNQPLELGDPVYVRGYAQRGRLVEVECEPSGRVTEVSVELPSGIVKTAPENVTYAREARATPDPRFNVPDGTNHPQGPGTPEDGGHHARDTEEAEACRQCGGAGEFDTLKGPSPETCDHCGGSGREPQS